MAAITSTRVRRLSWPPAVKRMIATMVQDEGPDVLKDTDLVDGLAASGIPVTISTVRKYRKALGISSAPERSAEREQKKSGPQAA